MAEPQTSENISTKMERIAKLAKEAPDMTFRSLAHYIDINWLREAYRRTRKDGAAGIDHQTAAQYAERLEENLASLLERAKAGTYRAPPVRRVHIPKDNGETRPLGVPTFEDKVLQRAVAMVLEAVYEQDFLACSYGFRPERSAHQALETLQCEMTWMRGGWVLEVDVRKFFDTLDHGKLREVLGRRIRDGVLVRLIGKWLNAGVLERGELYFPSTGTPQGGVILPILANVFLHDVLDAWFHTEVTPCLSGKARLVRYADDAVFVFANERDARRVHDVLFKRFAKYGLELHPEKTKLVEFRRPDGKASQDDNRPRPRSFDFLGFTHFWGRSRLGKWVVWRKTAKDRFRRGLKRIGEWCRRHRHVPIRAQQQALTRKLRGHYEYFGLWGNSLALRNFAYQVSQTWWKWLRSRSQRPMPWQGMAALLKRLPLPAPRITHKPRIA